MSSLPPPISPTPQHMLSPAPGQTQPSLLESPCHPLLLRGSGLQESMCWGLHLPEHALGLVADEMGCLLCSRHHRCSSCCYFWGLGNWWNLWGAPMTALAWVAWADSVFHQWPGQRTLMEVKLPPPAIPQAWAPEQLGMSWWSQRPDSPAVEEVFSLVTGQKMAPIAGG